MRAPSIVVAVVSVLGLGACAQLGPVDSTDTTKSVGTDTSTAVDTAAGSTDTGTGTGADTGAATPVSCADAERGPSDLSRGRDGSFSPTSDVAQQAALVRVNSYRVAAGLSPLRGDARLEHSATAHANFLAGNDQQTCWPHVHDESEASGCSGFTGADVGARALAQGYDWSRASEVVDWEDSPERAVDAWVWTVYHRQPLFDWRLTDAGFGHAQGAFGAREGATHDVMNLGVARDTQPAPTAPSAPVVFPLPGQTDVPPAFRGDLEAPTPPAPGGQRTWPTGLSAGTVVSVHFPSSNFRVLEHQILVSDGNTCQELPHTFVSHENDPNLQRPTPANDVFFYADQALEPGREYVAHVRATVDGQSWERTWAFRTRAE